MSACQTCGAPLPPNKSPGRRRVFCSERCRKRQYDLACVDCGGRVSGTDPKDRAAEPRCAACRAIYQHESRRWTRETVIAAIQRWADEHGGIPPSAPQWFRPGRPEWAPCTNTVLYEFGSWSAGIAAAGFSPRAVGHYGRDGEDPDLCREIAERYEAGEGSWALAREYGCGVHTIVERARRAGATIRPPGRTATSEARRARAEAA